MYLTMNRFRVLPGQEAAFEAVWAGRQSHLPEVPGFKSFSLMRGASTADHTLFASHTIWASEADFQAWTKSEAFRAAHAGAGATRTMLAGPPELEVFSAVPGVAA